MSSNAEKHFEAALLHENSARAMEEQAAKLTGRTYQGEGGILRLRALALRALAESSLYRAVSDAGT